MARRNRTAPKRRRRRRAQVPRPIAGLSLAARNYLRCLVDPQHHLSCVIDQYGAYSRCFRSRAVINIACGASNNATPELVGGAYFRPSVENTTDTIWALPDNWTQATSGTWTGGEGTPYPHNSSLAPSYFVSGGGTARSRIVSYKLSVQVTSPPQVTSGIITVVREPGNRNLAGRAFAGITASEQVRNFTANELCYRQAHVVYNNVLPAEFDYTSTGTFSGGTSFAVLATGYNASYPPTLRIQATAVFEVIDEELLGAERSVTDLSGFSKVKEAMPDISSWCDGDGSFLCKVSEAASSGFSARAADLAGNAGSWMANAIAFGGASAAAYGMNRFARGGNPRIMN